MILFCEECGAKNFIDPTESRGDLSCPFCNTPLRIQPSAEAAAPVAQTAEGRLELRFQDQTFNLAPPRDIVTLGRMTHNDIAVGDGRSSRSHARVECRDNDFLLVDHSKNGTFVHIEGKKPLSLKQDVLPLTGRGIIGLGLKVDNKSRLAIHFSLS